MLNEAQQEAVNTITGPVLIIARSEEHTSELQSRE